MACVISKDKSILKSPSLVTWHKAADPPLAQITRNIPTGGYDVSLLQRSLYMSHHE